MYRCGTSVLPSRPLLAHVLVLAHAAHVHDGSDVGPSLALPVQGPEAVFAVAVSAGGAHALHGVDVAHRALHLRVAERRKEGRGTVGASVTTVYSFGFQLL